MIPIQQDIGDLYARYDRSLLNYDGVVYYAVAGDEDMETYFSLYRVNNPEDKVLEVDPYDPKLDSKSIPLGYVNLPNHCTYIQRSPYRQWRQGVAMYTIEDYLGREAFRDHTDWMLQGVYPTMLEADNLLRTMQRAEVAISRNLKIVVAEYNEKYNVYCKEQKVGQIPDATQSLTIEIDNYKLAKVLQPYLAGFSWKVKNGTS